MTLIFQGHHSYNLLDWSDMLNYNDFDQSDELVIIRKVKKIVTICGSLAKMVVIVSAKCSDSSLIVIRVKKQNNNKLEKFTNL